MTKLIRPEFSRFIEVNSLGSNEIARSISANDAERAKLCRRFALISMARLDATLKIRRLGIGQIEIDGHFSAEVVQACVVTLEPVSASIEADFTRTFSDRPVTHQREVDLDVDEEEPDMIEEGRIDLGELVAEELALVLDPYPRKPGAEFQGGVGEGNGEPGSGNNKL